MWPNPRETADLVTFTAEILNGKLHFLCSACLSFLTDKVLKEFNEGLLTEISCGVSHGPILGPLLFLIYVNDMLQVETSTLLLYTNDSFIMYQDKEIKQVEKKLNEEFENLCDSFVDNKLSLHFGQDKAKSILFSRKRRAKNIRQ